MQALADAAPHAVLVTDGGIAQHGNVYAKLLDYAHSGGILVFMGTFSSFTRPSDFQSLFQKAGLPWKAGDYHRTTVYRNDTDTDATSSSRAELPASYSQKAVFLTGVPRKYAWYLPNASSRTESLVFPPAPIADQSQTPVAFADLGTGKLGYVGDVNGEEGSEAVVLAMCGLRGSA
ncbi:uncharacterized protein SETTUDRAFT_166407 [Exserohilum turcica Et28A]|uniref:Uncharacterized protein n=1 Tax=Exserohilum turcicum (strain 28A) TaxID=671987 RepID=R0I643_EXST2|nr:uncharacterized protein SETTUDRAFT_166407 [Exserohilum turcica Et28A]EOA81001.1 hypothetical protein SETTUDRAFT_166407 [Exserohilum turcica Et28A]